MARTAADDATAENGQNLFRFMSGQTVLFIIIFSDNDTADDSSKPTESKQYDLIKYAYRWLETFENNLLLHRRTMFAVFINLTYTLKDRFFCFFFFVDTERFITMTCVFFFVRGQLFDQKSTEEKHGNIYAITVSRFCILWYFRCRRRRPVKNNRKPETFTQYLYYRILNAGKFSKYSGFLLVFIAIWHFQGVILFYDDTKTAISS